MPLTVRGPQTCAWVDVATTRQAAAILSMVIVPQWKRGGARIGLPGADRLRRLAHEVSAPEQPARTGVELALSASEGRARRGNAAWSARGAQPSHRTRRFPISKRQEQSQLTDRLPLKSYRRYATLAA